MADSNAEPEAPLLPDLPILDPHHHLRDRHGAPYMLPDFLVDLATGHNIVATVAVETGFRYFEDGPVELRPVGETVFLAGIATECEAAGAPRVNAGIVGHAELRLGERVRQVLEAHIEAAGGRFRGIRYPTAWDRAAVLEYSRAEVAEGTLLDPAFRAGVGCLADYGLSLDVWVYHPQLPQVTDLARAFPDTTIILNHVGGPAGVGPYADRRDEVFATWSSFLGELSRCPNVFVKIGGFGMPMMGFSFPGRTTLPKSTELAAAWRPYVERAIEAFGPARAMFESNFPPDKVSCGYDALWNAFKRIAADCSADERAALFSRTAISAYRLTDLGV